MRFETESVSGRKERWGVGGRYVLRLIGGEGIGIGEMRAMRKICSGEWGLPISKEVSGCLHDTCSGYYPVSRARKRSCWGFCAVGPVRCDMVRQAGLMRLSIALPKPCFAITKAGQIDLNMITGRGSVAESFAIDPKLPFFKVQPLHEPI